MRRVLVLAAVTALAVARPETYKEKEDFQYSRSSSDDGTKSGFYGAQRGNMGGNYERAHNMDSLAQHQMGSLVRNVEGELGDGAKENTGSVFTAANSRGTYGSGHYDLSNLAGRNFQEGTSYGDSQSHSSLSSHQAGYGSNSRTYSSSSNSAYGSQSQDSRYHGYNSAANSDRALYDSNIQSADNLQASEYDNTRATHGSGRYIQSGYQGQNSYDQAAASQQLSNAYGTYNTRGSQYRLVGASPVRVIIRPGSTVTVPVAAQSFDASRGSSSTFDQNSINTDAVNQLGFRPTGEGKHYESSYNYRKEWEKHDTVTAVPLAVPTTYRPYPSNSELYEDSEAHGSVRQQESRSQESRNNYSNSQHRGYSGTKSGSSSHQASYSAQQQGVSDTSALSSGSLGTQGLYGANNLNTGNLNSQVEDFSSAPKSYQSSYSYHKSWERQGDPYVIQPSMNGAYTSDNSQAAQRLTSSSLNQGSSYGSHQYGSRYQQGHSADCDENGHIRVARSYNSYQQTHNIDEGQEQLGQQAQNLEDFGQQSQNLEDFGQQSQNLQDFGQQYQNLENLGQQPQKREDFGQESQNLENFGQETQNLENFGQESQNLQDFGQETQNLENFGQETQNLENFGQESQNLQDFGQETQNLENFGQQSQNLHDFGQETQNLQNFGQQTQQNFGQESQNLDNIGQQTQQNFGQESQNLEDFSQQSQNVQNLGQQTQNLADFGQATQNTFDKIEDLSQHTQNQQTEAGQETQNTWDILETQQSTNHHYDQQSQGSALEINHTSVNRPESHTVDDKLNPFAIFETHHPEENTMVDDINKRPGQQTHSFNSYVDQNTYNSYFPASPSNSDSVSHNHRDWQTYLDNHHIHINTGRPQHESVGTWNLNKPYDASINTNFPGNMNTNYNPNPWSFNPSYTQPSQNIPLPHYGQTYTNTQTYYQPEFSNTYTTNTQTYVNRYNHSTFSTSNVHIKNTTSLTNLWDLIDEIEKDTIPEHHEPTVNCTEQEKDQINIDTDYTQHNNENSFNSNNKVNLTQNLNEVSLNNNGKVDSVELSTVATKTIKNESLRPHDVERGDIGTEKPKPQHDLGRGDIEPEDSSDEEFYTPSKPLEVFGANNTQPKTPEEIESLSLTKESNKTSALSINKQLNNYVSLNENRPHHSEQDNWKLQIDTQKTTTTPKTIYGYEHSQFNEGQEVQHNIAQQFELGQVEQQTYNHQENYNQKEVTNEDQQNINHLVDFGQQSEQNFQNFDQQNVNLGQQIIHHSVSSLEVNNDDIQQQNAGQQTEENIDQQNFNQFNLGQQTQQFEQDLQSHGQQDGHFHQQTLENFDKHEQLQQESLSNYDQETGDFGQENVNLEPQRQTGDLWNTDVQQQKKSQLQLLEPPSTENKEGKALHSEPVQEPDVIIKEASNVEAPPEPVTEKVGFWNKVSSKLSSAKNKVKLWFSSS